jgi:MFS family permease
LESAGYGLLYGCMGIGAVLSAVLLPKVRTKLSPDATLATGTVGFAVVLLALALIKSPWLAAGAMLLGGVAWMSMLSSLNVAVQVATPSWVRARVLSIYMIVFQGAIALGSVVWGVLAAKTSLRIAFIASGATMLVGNLAGRHWFRLSARAPDFSPSLHWPKPVLVCEPAAEDGPVLVTMEYRVPSENVRMFVEAANRVQRLRRRSGAYQWGMFRDPSAPEKFVVSYRVDSWADHVREHERVTVDERDAEARLDALVVAGTQPIVTHLIAVPPDAASETISPRGVE